MTDQKRPRQKHSAKAWDEGKAARESRTPRGDCPYTPDQRPQTRAWLDGWDSVGPLTNVHVHVPAGVQVRIEASVGSCFVPAGQDINPLLVYWKPFPNLVPCRKCRRTQLDSGSPACVNNGEHQGVAHMLCRDCGERFKVPVKQQQRGEA